MNRKDIERKIKLGQLGAQKRRSPQIRLTRIGRRDPDTGLYEARQVGGEVRRGIRIFNSGVPADQVVRSTQVTENLVALDWRNRIPSELSQEQEVEVIKPLVLYSHLNLEDSAVSIVFRTLVEEPTKCTCPTWKRVGNRCIQVCDSVSSYTTLAECLAAPLSWPPPEGQDGGGGYWVLYAGYKIGTRGSSGYEYSNGSWTGGLFYESLVTNCSSVELDYVAHYAPISFVDGNESNFPANTGGSAYYYYYSLPMVPKLDLSRYPGGILSYLKNETSTSGILKVDADGWFAYAVYDVDIFFSATNTWYAGDDVAFGVCFVGKYCPASSFNDGVPSPPDMLWDLNISGVELIHNRADFECGGGSDSPEEEPPEDKRAYRYFLGGSKRTPIQLCQLNYSDPHDFYIATTDLNKNQSGEIETSETINFLLGRHESGSFCKCLNIEIKGNEIAKTLLNYPILPQPNSKDWRRSLLDYTYPPEESGDAVVDLYRSNKFYNLIRRTEQEQSIYHLFSFDSGQSVNGVVFGTLIKSSSTDKAIINYSLKDGDRTLTKTVETSVYGLNSPQAQLMACSPYIDIRRDFFAGGAIEESVDLGNYAEGDYQWLLSVAARRFTFTIKSDLESEKFKKLKRWLISTTVDAESSESTDFNAPILPEIIEADIKNLFSQTYEYPFPDPPTQCLKELILQRFKIFTTSSKLISVDAEQAIADADGTQLGKLDALLKLPRERIAIVKIRARSLSEEGATCSIGEGLEKQVKVFGLGVNQDEDLSYWRIEDVAIAMWRMRR